MSHHKTPAFLCCCLFTDIIAEYVFGGKREMEMGVGRGTRMGEVLASSLPPTHCVFSSAVFPQLID